jgi:hypothetical protein
LLTARCKGLLTHLVNLCVHRSPTGQWIISSSSGLLAFHRKLYLFLTTSPGWQSPLHPLCRRVSGRGISDGLALLLTPVRMGFLKHVWADSLVRSRPSGCLKPIAFNRSGSYREVLEVIPVVAPRFGYILHPDGHCLSIFGFPSGSKEPTTKTILVIHIRPQSPVLGLLRAGS